MLVNNTEFWNGTYLGSDVFDVATLVGNSNSGVEYSENSTGGPLNLVWSKLYWGLRYCISVPANI